MAQFHFDPATYEALMADEVPGYGRLQEETAAATAGTSPRTILDLGTGTGVTAHRVLAAHPGAGLVGIDESAEMLGAARRLLPPTAELRVAHLEDPLPPGPFELVVSALAVHHLDAGAKAALFGRVAGVLAPGGRFVLGDVIVPVEARDITIPIDDDYDKPSTVADQLGWLDDAGLTARVVWQERDLAVIIGDRTAAVGP